MTTHSQNGLTPQQARLVQQFLIDFNATQAAIRVGYFARTATVQGSRLLTNAKVRSAIEVL
jgi:phage terminase small subunit